MYTHYIDGTKQLQQNQSVRLRDRFRPSGMSHWFEFKDEDTEKRTLSGTLQIVLPATAISSAKSGNVLNFDSYHLYFTTGDGVRIPTPVRLSSLTDAEREKILSGESASGINSANAHRLALEEREEDTYAAFTARGNRRERDSDDDDDDEDGVSERRNKAYNLQDESADSLMNFEYYDAKIAGLQDRERSSVMNENHARLSDSGGSSSKKKKKGAGADVAEVVDPDYELDYATLSPIDRSILDHVQYLYDPESHSAVIPHLRPHYTFHFSQDDKSKTWDATPVKD